MCLNPVKNLKGPWENKPHHHIFPAMSRCSFFLHSAHCDHLCVIFVGVLQGKSLAAPQLHKTLCETIRGGLLDPTAAGSKALCLDTRPHVQKLQTHTAICCWNACFENAGPQHLFAVKGHLHGDLQDPSERDLPLISKCASPGRLEAQINQRFGLKLQTNLAENRSTRAGWRATRTSRDKHATCAVLRSVSLWMTVVGGGLQFTRKQRNRSLR